MEPIRGIIIYKAYFDAFFEPLPPKLKDKIDEVLFMFTIIGRVPIKFFKRIEGVKGLFEFGLSMKVIFAAFSAALIKGI